MVFLFARTRPICTRSVRPGAEGDSNDIEWILGELLSTLDFSEEQIRFAHWLYWRDIAQHVSRILPKPRSWQAITTLARELLDDG